MPGLTRITDGIYMTDTGEVVHMDDTAASQFGYYQQPNVSDLVDAQAATVPPHGGEGPVPQDVLEQVAAPPPQQTPGAEIPPGQGLVDTVSQPEAAALAQPPQAAAPPQGGVLPAGAYSQSASGTYHTVPIPGEPPPADLGAIGGHPDFLAMGANQAVETAREKNAIIDQMQADMAANQEQQQAARTQESYDRHYAQIQEQERQAREDQVYQNAQQTALDRWNSIKQVDPNRVFHNSSALGEMADILGAVIGGFLSPYNGGKNQYLEWVNQRIQQDIDAQQANIQTQMSQAYRGDRALGKLREDQSQNRQARAQAELDRRAAFDTVMAGLQEQYQSLPMRAKIDEARADNAQAAMDKIQELGRLQVEDDRYESEKRERVRQFDAQLRLERYKASQEAWARREGIQIEKDKLKGEDKIDPKSIVYDPATRLPIGHVSDEKRAAEVQKQLGAAAEFDARLQELVLRQKATGKQLVEWDRLSDEQQKEFNSLYEGALGLYILGKSGKVATEEEVKRARVELPISLLFGANAEKTQGKFRERALRGVNLGIADLQPFPGQENYDFASTSKKLGDTLGTGEAPPPVFFHELAAGVLAARNTQELAEQGTLFFQKAWEEKDTDGGRFGLRQLATELEKQGNPIMPDASEPSGGFSIADRLRRIADYGELTEQATKNKTSEEQKQNQQDVEQIRQFQQHLR